MATPGLVTSKITERNQTTLPPSVRSVLGLEGGERLGYVIDGSQVRLVNASALDRDDPVLESFLGFLARNIEAHPETLAPFPTALLSRARDLTRDVHIDHDAPIEGKTAL
ncbi:MAG: type II toxin-antitoxin system PrlF family antitoxin [Longimicrobiales bacterium]|nr:type II toxin-antitoxin system PrlF family antitoxin [Longimicrobiales bacterium]